MSIGDNLEHLETHYLKVWIRRWRQQLEEHPSEKSRIELQTLIAKAEREITRRKK